MSSQCLHLLHFLVKNVITDEVHRMQELTISKAIRGALSEAVARARYAGERTMLLVHGRPAAVLISLEDAVQLPAPKEAPKS